MSDVLSDAQMYLSDPDETVLTAALRNKDDIPILMDIVGDDDVSTPVSQEMYLKQSLSHDEEKPVESESPKQQAKSDALSTQDTATASIKPNAHKDSPSFKYEPPEKTEYKYHQYEPPEGNSASVEKPAHKASSAQSDVARSVAKTVEPATEAIISKTVEADQADIIAAAIRSVLERRLPELVADVMTEISKRKQQ